MTVITLFDLDKTLLNGDSDHGWGEFLSARNYVDAAYYKKQNDYFYGQYSAGTLDIFAFCEFSLKVLAENPLPVLEQWREEYLAQHVDAMILPQALDLVKKHQDAGHIVVLTTATNDFVTAPIAQKLGIQHLIATRAELKNGQYTGRLVGTPNFKEGKVTRLHEWLKDQSLSPQDLATSYAYSDSINDVPLLEMAAFPIATNPDLRLKQLALEKRWPILELFA